MNKKDELAYGVMASKNRKNDRTGGYFSTIYGILHLWQGRHGWEYEYVWIEELPKEFKKEFSK